MPDDKLSPERAIEIIGVAASASSDERHRVFREKRAILEKKLGQAPTEGLKAKYRGAIEELERAIETLELAQTEQDLGTVRPIFTRDEAAPRVDAPVGSGPAPSSASRASAGGDRGRSIGKRQRSKREFGLGVAVVSVIAVVVGGWWWKVDRDRTAEQGRQKELARQEAIGRAARTESEREAAEASAAQLRNDEEGRREAERKTRAELATILASVDAEMETLTQKSGLVDREISRTDSELRELARGGAVPELSYLRERKRLLDEYAAWLREYTARHPARIALKAARDLGSSDPSAALLKAQESQAAAQKILAEVSAARTAKVGVVLWEMVARQQGAAVDTLLARVSGDELEGGKSWATDEKKRLAYLDSPSARLRGNELERLQMLRAISSGDDADIARWAKHFQARNGQPWTVTFGDARIELGWIAPGTFMMGSPSDELGRYDNEARRQVAISRGFWLGKYEVTQEQWQAVMRTTPRQQRDKKDASWGLVGEGANLPMYYVSWDEAVEFCRRVTAQERAAGRIPEGYAYTLPTEAEWEYACRAETTTAVYTGALRMDSDFLRAPELDGIAWYAANSTVTGSDQTYTGTYEMKYGDRTIKVSVDRGAVHSVGGKRPNAWGLYDMIGNVWEWCRDRYGIYPEGAVTDPTGATSGTNRVNRGGSCFYSASYCRSAYRFWLEPGLRNDNLGFRLALSSVP